jgi:hypothetical protein
MILVSGRRPITAPEKSSMKLSLLGMTDEGRISWQPPPGPAP